MTTIIHISTRTVVRNVIESADILGVTLVILVTRILDAAGV
jgi:hypothetical protein